MWLASGYRPALERAGLATFEQVMAASHGRCMRVVGDRENWYLQAPDAARPAVGMYLKKHRVRTWLTRLGARLGMPLPASAGRIEAQNVASLAALAIDVPRLVAYGEKFSADGRLESFLLTEELSGYVELQEFVRRRFPACARRGPARDRDLARLVRQVAGIARRFHRAGYNHRDFYSYHFLTKEPAPGRFDIRLIDLQRMQRRRWFRRRWIVKDLAQLAAHAVVGRLPFLPRQAGLHAALPGGAKARRGRQATDPRGAAEASLHRAARAALGARAMRRNANVDGDCPEFRGDCPEFRPTKLGLSPYPTKLGLSPSAEQTRQAA